MTPNPQQPSMLDPRTLQHMQADPDVFDHLSPTVRIVMSSPQYLSTKISNNVFMNGKSEPVDRPRAMRQWNRIVNMIEALDTPVLQIPSVPDGQDQVYTANVLCAIKPYIVLAKYKAPGRDVEVPPAKQFMESMGYQCIQPPYYFEGEADLKKVKDGFYFGGWGQFSDPKAFQWIMEQTGVEIALVHEINPKAFHLDCSLFVINEETFLVGEGGLDDASLKTLEKHGEVIYMPKEFVIAGVTNGVKFPDKQIFLSGTFQPEVKSYRETMETLNEVFDRFGYTVVLMDVDAFEPSGADLSCCVAHLDFYPDDV